jgi:single-strand DNA-binding protein
MMNDAQVVLAGFVASEPAFKQLAGGTSAATLRVAYTPRHLNRETGEWADGTTSFVTVLCWRTLADNVAVSLRKGEPVLVSGRLRVRPYEDREGAPRIAVEVDANSIGHDLTRGVAHFSRTRKAPGETAAASAQTQSVQAQPGGEDLPDGPAGTGPAAGTGSAGTGSAGGTGEDAAEGLAGDGVIDDSAVAGLAGEVNESLTGTPSDRDPV